MARSVDLEETERRLLLRLGDEEWKRLDEIRTFRNMNNDPILGEQQDIERLLDKLK